MYLNKAETLKSNSERKSSFYLPVTLWVYGKKVQVNALIDSGATTSFINKSVVRANHLVTHQLQTGFDIYNANGTLN